LKEEGYDVKVAHPLMVKAIAYAKVKNDKVDGAPRNLYDSWM
jgi:transposase